MSCVLGSGFDLCAGEQGSIAAGAELYSGLAGWNTVRRSGIDPGWG